MHEKWIKVRSSEGGDFDCYLNVPKTGSGPGGCARFCGSRR